MRPLPVDECPHPRVAGKSEGKTRPNGQRSKVSTMRTLIHARDEDALRNGSYIRQTIGKRNSTYSQIMNGDFIAWLHAPPPGLKIYTLKEATKLIPKNCG